MVSRPRTPLTPRALRAGVAALAAGTFLFASGCDGSREEAPAHTHRLLVAEQGAASLNVIDLDRGERTATLPLAGPVRAYMMAGGTEGRHVFLAPTNGPIQTVDAGIFRQGSRVVQQAPAVLPFNVPGENLVHLTRGGSMIAGFYDGTGETRYFDAARVAEGGTAPVVTIASGRAHHGVAVAAGSVMLLSRPVEGQTLPNGVRVHNLATGALISDPEATCPGLHGEAKAASSVVGFGCTDGLLIARAQGGTATVTKVPYPAGVASPLRSGTLHGHESVPYLVAHIGGGGQNVGPAIYDPAANSMRMLAVPGRAPYARGYRFSTDGRYFLVLGLDGALHVFDAASLTLRGSVADLARALPDPIPSGTLYPQVVATGRFAYVSDPAQNTIKEVDLATRAVTRTMTMPFQPGVLALAGRD